MMAEIFRTILSQPLFNGLVLLYERASFGDLGVAIILLTLIVRVILFPLFHKTAKHQKIAQRIQPEIKKIQQKHKNDKETQTRELMELYKKHQVNPLTPILLLIIQLPILFAVYKIFRDGISADTLSMLYSFVPVPENVSHTFLGLVELNAVSIPIAVAAAMAQYVQGKLATARAKNQDAMSAQARNITKTMIYLGPIVALVVLTKFPAAVGLYWLTSTLFSIIQQTIVNKSMQKEDE
mgnify:CR=1 FL=1